MKDAVAATKYDGTMARMCGVPRHRNPYDSIFNADLHSAWEDGWQEGNEEVVLLNLAAVVQELIENANVTEETVTLDGHLFRVLCHAAQEARAFIE